MESSIVKKARRHTEIRRARIVSVIQSRPGIRYRELVPITKLAHGTLNHNIKRLERQRRIRVGNDRDFTCFFPENYDEKFYGAIACVGHCTTTAIMDSSLLLANECNFSQIKKAVTRGSLTICEHLKQLCLAGLVSRRMAKNRAWVYTITDMEMETMIINQTGASNNW
jgi:predicted transcriptional regulator